MLTVRYTNPAKADLRGIANYIEAQAGAASAKATINKIRSQVRTLARVVYVTMSAVNLERAGAG